jgi:hypothetical protein
LIFDESFVYCILDNGMVATQYTTKQLEHYEVYSFTITGSEVVSLRILKVGVGPTKPVEVNVVPLDSMVFVKSGKDTSMFRLMN